MSQYLAIKQALLPSTNAATDSAATLPAPVSVQNRLKRPFSGANNQQPPSSPAPAASSEKKGLIVRRPSGRASLEKDVPTAAAKKNADSTRKVSDPGGVGRCGPQRIKFQVDFFLLVHDA